jgi:hypothetical protein
MATRPLVKVYDVTGIIDGPIVRDRLWYVVTGHRGGSTRESLNVFYNLNAGDPSEWRYAADFSRPSYSDRLFENASGRVTWRVTRRNTITGFWDVQALCRTCTGATPGLSEPARVSPEAVGVLGRRLDVAQATWSSPLTNQVFLDAGFGATSFGVGNFEREPNPTRDLIRVVEQCAEGCADNGNIPGLVYRSQDFSATRSQFSLWPSITAGAKERVIVPLARLKGVFFVRDFAGNPGYVERDSTSGPQHGRRIEVTLVDDEVITGRTLSYRHDGHGFFVFPADPMANNIRIFVVSTSVRQVRFP